MTTGTLIGWLIYHLSNSGVQNNSSIIDKGQFKGQSPFFELEVSHFMVFQEQNLV